MKLEISKIHSYHFIKEYIEDKQAKLLNELKVKIAFEEIKNSLSNYNINFEGNKLPISITPTVLLHSNVAKASDSGKIIWRILNKAIDKFISEHNNNQVDSPLHKFFSPYQKWWDLIALEIRKLPQIQLMRYDAILDTKGNWSFIETNTNCPGGVIHCAKIRDAWKTSTVGKETCEGLNISEYPLDNPERFVYFLIEQARKINNGSANIAILNYKNIYTNELNSLKNTHSYLVETGKIHDSTLTLGDIRELNFIDGITYLNGIKIDLVYNKMDNLMIDPLDSESKNWIYASQSKNCEFLNGIGAMFLSEAKRILALITDIKMIKYLDITEREIDTIRDLIPPTQLLEEIFPNDNEINIANLNKDIYVLKADCLTRGEGVILGNNILNTEWGNSVKKIKKHNGVSQVMCNIPTKNGYYIDDNNNLYKCSEYYGIDLFYLDGEFSGAVSRAHIDQVFNIGNGGKESPVIIIND